MVLICYLIMLNYERLCIVDLFNNLVFQCFFHYVFKIATLSLPPNYPE